MQSSLFMTTTPAPVWIKRRFSCSKASCLKSSLKPVCFYWYGLKCWIGLLGKSTISMLQWVFWGSKEVLPMTFRLTFEFWSPPTPFSVLVGLLFSFSNRLARSHLASLQTNSNSWNWFLESFPFLFCSFPTCHRKKNFRARQGTLSFFQLVVEAKNRFLTIGKLLRISLVIQKLLRLISLSANSSHFPQAFHRPT